MMIRFEPYHETWTFLRYIILTVNGVKGDKKVGHVLNNIRAKAYAVLRNLLAPDKLKDSSLANMKKLVMHL